MSMPTFILRADDLLAPVVLNLYAIQCTMHQVDSKKVQEIRDLSIQMKAWQEVHGCHKPGEGRQGPR